MITNHNEDQEDNESLDFGKPNDGKINSFTRNTEVENDAAKHRPNVITINSDNDIISDNEKEETANIQQRLSPTSYTNICTDSNINNMVFENNNKKQRKSSKKKKKRKILFSDKSKSNHKFHKMYKNNRINIK